MKDTGRVGPEEALREVRAVAWLLGPCEHTDSNTA
eukprot:CAMPEP_0201099078 /NCGR_PEP_ID=MMETSP0812-20130820/8083_1 /ASSEMBLY_ACC=CAM_ASM_000668 /TAXON_ID=98059 /ORGANISM="Dinobryon sp., Strain UTEXLB2267" /LENGTH=34 /DNA_ID= /DNA_START= /DNA_END= /DNA_ORIENTATION=